MPVIRPDNSPNLITRRRAINLVCATLIVGGTGMAVMGARSFFQDQRDARRYSDLSRGSVASFSVDGYRVQGEGPLEQSATRDWQALVQENPDVAAWITVAGTPIDLPAVQARSNADLERWLSTDFWGNPSSLGCPCIDPVLTGANTHTAVYAHHLTEQPMAMFSPLSDCYKSERFHDLGPLLWETPDGNALVLQPLCAANVHETDLLFTDPIWQEADLGAWLNARCARADALASGWEALVASARKAVTLITCSGAFSNMPWRSAVTFCCPLD